MLEGTVQNKCEDLTLLQKGLQEIIQLLLLEVFFVLQLKFIAATAS